MGQRYSTYVSDRYGFGVGGLQAAIDAAYGAGGGDVEIHPGTTYIDSQVNLKANVRLVGSGVLERDSSYSGAMISISGADNAGIDGVTIDGGLSPATRDTDTWAVLTTTTGIANGVGLDIMEDWWVIDEGTTDSAVVVSGSDHVTISQCRLLDHGGCGVFVDGSSSGSDYVTVDGCEIIGCRRDGVYHTRGDNLVVRDCTITEFVGSGIQIKPEAVGHEVVAPLVQGNTIISSRGVSNKYMLPATWALFSVYGTTIPITPVNYVTGIPLVVTSRFSNSGHYPGPDGIRGYGEQATMDLVRIADNHLEIKAPSDDWDDTDDSVYNVVVSINVSRGTLDAPCRVLFADNTVRTNLSSGQSNRPAGVIDYHGNPRVLSTGNNISCRALPSVNNAHSAIEVEAEFWDQSDCDVMRGLSFSDNVYGAFRYAWLGRCIDGLTLDMNTHIGNVAPDGSSVCFGTASGKSVDNAVVRGVYVGSKHGFRGGNCENVLFDGCTFIIADATGTKYGILDPYGAGENTGGYLKNVRLQNCSVNHTVGDATGTGRAISSGSVTCTATPQIMQDATIQSGDVVILTAKNANGATTTAYVSAVADGSFTITGCNISEEFYYMAIPANAAASGKTSLITKNEGGLTYKALLPSGTFSWLAAAMQPGVTAGWESFWAVTDYDSGADAWAAATDLAPYPFTWVSNGSGQSYVCIKDNGPDTPNGVQALTETAYWFAVDADKDSATEYDADQNYWYQPMHLLSNSGGVSMTTSGTDDETANPHTFINCSEVGTAFVDIDYTELED